MKPLRNQPSQKNALKAKSDFHLAEISVCLFRLKIRSNKHFHIYINILRIHILALAECTLSNRNQQVWSAASLRSETLLRLQNQHARVNAFCSIWSPSGLMRSAETAPPSYYAKILGLHEERPWRQEGQSAAYGKSRGAVLVTGSSSSCWRL